MLARMSKATEGTWLGTFQPSAFTGFWVGMAWPYTSYGVPITGGVYPVSEGGSFTRFGHIDRLFGVGEAPSAARALTVVAPDQRRERGWLRQGHDRPERQ